MRTAVAAALSIAALSFAAPAAADGVIQTQLGPVQVTTFATGLVNPWGIALLPAGRMLVTERPGRLRVVEANGALSAPLTGLPANLAVGGQGGLFDVVLHPKFSRNGLIFLSFAESGSGGRGTAVARARLEGNALTGTTVIWRATKTSGEGHFGGRLAFQHTGYLFVTTGDKQLATPSQDLGGTLGKVVRITTDGVAPGTNPYFGQTGKAPETWSFGHRNVQGAAVNPVTNRLWINEHGPQGGDEVQPVYPARNYGWPLASNGRNYGSPTDDIPDHRAGDGFQAPAWWWDPAIAPAGMTFYNGIAFPQWSGNLLIGALAGQMLVRLTTTTNGQVTAEERIPMGDRIRDVQQGPAGELYLLTDSGSGRILRLTPAP